MKLKYGLLAILFVSSLALTQTAKAQDPLFSFLDGKVYNIEGTLKFICFMNNECLGADDKKYTRDEVFGNIPEPKYTDAISHPYDETQTLPTQPATQTTTSVDLKTQYQQQINSLNSQLETINVERDAWRTDLQSRISGMTQDFANQYKSQQEASNPRMQELNKQYQEIMAQRDAIQAKLNTLP